MKSLTCAVLLIGLAGCGTWSRPNTTEQQFQRDQFECEQHAARMYPVQMQATGQGFQAPSQTSCSTYYGQTRCTTAPGAYTPPQQSDVNAISRAMAVPSCLRSRGYVHSN